MQSKLDHSIHIALGGNPHKIICRSFISSNLVGSKRKAEMSFSIGGERIVVFFVRREARIRRQVQKVLAALIEQNLDARARNRHRTAGAASEYQTKRINNHRPTDAFNWRDIVST